MSRAGGLYAAAIMLLIDQATKYVLPVVVVTDHLALAMRLIALGALIAIYSSRREKGAGTLLLLVIGAGMSNIIDILLFRYVRDVFVVYELAFNLADVVLIAGIIVLIPFLLRRPAV